MLTFIGFVELGCRIKDICPLEGSWPVGECPRWRSFQGTLTRIYASFGESHGKLRTARSTGTTGI